MAYDPNQIKKIQERNSTVPTPTTGIPNPRDMKPTMVANPREVVKTPAQISSSNVPTNVASPSTARTDIKPSLNTPNPNVAPNPTQFAEMNKNASTIGADALKNTGQLPTKATPVQKPVYGPEGQGSRNILGWDQSQTVKTPTSSTGLNFDNSMFGDTPTKPLTPPKPTGQTGPATPTTPEQPVPTGQPQIGGMEGVINQAGQNMMAGAEQYLTAGQKMAGETMDVAENARRLDTIAALNGTNAKDMAAAMGVSLENMSMAQLEQLAVSSGLAPDKSTLDRIQQEGAAAIDSVRMERGDIQAEIKFQADQLARTFGRAVTDREKFNLAQDAKLRNMMSVFGGGVSSSTGGNMAILQAQEVGQKALEDLTSEYAGRADLISRKMTATIREYGEKERQIQSQVTGAIESKYAELQKTFKDLRAQGVTNKKDFQTAMQPYLKEYANFYQDATKWQAEKLIDAQKTVFDQAEKTQRLQMDQDKIMSEQSGAIVKNGQPLLDSNGQPIPTMDALQQYSEMDYKMSQNTGIVYKDGQPLLDQNGQPIPTADMYQFSSTESRLKDEFNRTLGFNMSKEQFNQAMEQAKFSQNAYEFETNTGIKLNEVQFQNLKFQADMADKGLQFKNGVDLTATGSINPAKSKYGIVPTENGITVNAPVSGTKLVSGRRQCGEYVNDVLGIPSYFGNTIEQKKTKVQSMTPTPGSAFILDIPGLKWGHVGIVEKVNPDGTLTISESNYDGNENFRRITTSVADLQKRGLVGFTGGLQPKVTGIEKNPNAPLAKGKQLDATQVKMLSDAKFLPNIMGELKDLISGNQVSFGPVENTLRNLNPLTGFGAYDVPQRSAEAQLRRATQLVGSFMEGGVLRKEDEEKYAKMLPSLGDSKEIAQQKLEGVKQMLESKRQGYIQDFGSSGYDVSGLKDINLSNSNQVSSMSNILPSNVLRSQFTKYGLTE